MGEGPERESYKQQIPDCSRTCCMHGDLIFTATIELAVGLISKLSWFKNLSCFAELTFALLLFCQYFVNQQVLYSIYRDVDDKNQVSLIITELNIIGSI
jgi:hypothetical protein